MKRTADNRRRLRRLLLTASGAALAAGAYMAYEAQWLQLRRLKLELPGLPPALDGLKVLHVSDLHAGAFGPAGRAIDKFITTAAGLDPDLVLFTGDMTDKRKDLSPYVERLATVNARLGKFAVMGNHDLGIRKTVVQELSRRLLGRSIGGRMQIDFEGAGVAVAASRAVLARAGIRLLENECALVRAGSVNVQLCGIGDYQYGFGDLEAAAVQFDASAGLRILLSHSPDAAAVVGPDEYHLVLSGHTHGGQICIPRPGGKILLSTSGSSFGDGVYNMRHTTMHVSRGVGTTLLPFRLFSRPEITMIELAFTRRSDPAARPLSPPSASAAPLQI